jgi:hypothetical protein
MAKKIIRSGFNKDRNQWWTEFVYEKKNYFIIWEVGTKDGMETFDIGVFPSSQQKEIVDGSSKRVNGKKKTNGTNTKSNAKGRS